MEFLHIDSNVKIDNLSEHIKKAISRSQLRSQLIEITGKSWQELENLTSLDLRRKQLKELPEAINELKDLEILYIDKNVKTNNLSEHIKKAISRSQLIEITGKDWRELENLTSLDLRRKQLKELPEAINELKDLEVLYINQDIKTDNLSEHIKKVISRTQLIEITRKTWEELKNLSSLSLYGNKLERLPETIGELKNLSSLDLGRNENLDFDGAFKKLSTLKNLSSLNLYKNKLERLPESIGGLKNLSSLNLYNNKLKRLPE